MGIRDRWAPVRSIRASRRAAARRLAGGLRDALKSRPVRPEGYSASNGPPLGLNSGQQGNGSARDRRDRRGPFATGDPLDRSATAGETPAPQRQRATPRDGFPRLCLDAMRRLGRHRQAVAVMPRDAGRKPCHAGIRDAPDGKADRVVNRDSEVHPGATPDKAGSDSQCQDNCLSLVHAMRRGSK